MTKRILAITLTLLILLSIAGCTSAELTATDTPKDVLSATEPRDENIPAQEETVPDETVNSTEPTGNESKPEITEPAVTDPEIENAPTEPAETIPAVTEPVNPTPTEPVPTEPKPTEPKPTGPTPTEPKPTEPKPTEPPVTEPPATEPPATEPAEVIDLDALVQYGLNYAADTHGYRIYPGTRAGYYPAYTCVFKTMEEGRAAIRGCVDDTTRALLAVPGFQIAVEIDGVMCRARIDIEIRPKGDGTYWVNVYYG